MSKEKYHAGKESRAYACSNETRTTEEELWGGIIQQALTDASYTPRGMRAKTRKSALLKRKKMEHRRLAIWWILSRHPQFLSVCENAGIQPHHVIMQLLRILIPPPPEFEEYAQAKYPVDIPITIWKGMRYASIQSAPHHAPRMRTVSDLQETFEFMQ